MSNPGYIPKDLFFGKEGRELLVSGITLISEAVKSTLGPLGKTVLIESLDHLGGLTVTKDGVTVAKAVSVDDPVANLAITMMKEAASRTAMVAGDGTTTAIVLAEAIVLRGLSEISVTHNHTEVLRYIDILSSKIIDLLVERSSEVDDSRLHDVATISANGDEYLGGIIAEAYKSVGSDGIVTVERSENNKTYSKITNGIRIDRGYSSNLFINDQKRDECILEDVHVLVCDMEITNILQLEAVLKPIVSRGERLLIIGECSVNVTNTLAANVMRNGLKLCTIIPPQFGYKKHELMQDIAIALGAKYFSEKTGDDLSLMRYEDLGFAEKIVVGASSSVLISGGGEQEVVTERIEALRVQQGILEVKHERDFIDQRIASLAGGIGCIYVGGNSDIEQKEKYDRVDDSVCAVRSALEEGILPGGGLALYRISEAMDSWPHETKEEMVAISILAGAIREPLRQILINASLDPKSVDIADGAYNFGYDVKNGTFGDMYDMGIIDPVKVTKNALRNAASVAKTILSTNAIITHARA